MKKIAAICSLAWVCGVLSAQSFSIQNVSQTAGGTSLTWGNAGAGLAYTVQTRDSLQGEVWTVPFSQAWPVTALNWSDTNASQSRYYRVAAVQPATRGKVISTTPIAVYSTGQIQFIFGFAGIPIVPQYNVTVLRVVYETIDPLGNKTTASGAVAFPLNVSGKVPLVSYQHGTTSLRTDVPSQANNDLLSAGLAFATTGYGIALPDYLGLGAGTGVQAYHHARSEATAGVDMLRAARTVAATGIVALNNQLFLCGYSQGGHATMALHRELEAFHTNEFTITASAPMAGAYDLSGTTLDDILSGRPYPEPFYFTLFLASYQSIYHLAPSLADLLSPPYNSTLPPVLDGSASPDAINALMPSDMTKVLKPEILADLRSNPHNPIRAALRDNDLIHWTPRSPMRMFHCSGDADVLVANSQVALASFHERGAAQVQLADPSPGSDHGDCIIPAFLAAKAWFDSLKQ